MGLLSWLGGKDRRNGNDFSIDIVIPLRSPPVIDLKKVVEDFARRWGTMVRFDDEEIPAEAAKGGEAHVLTNGKSRVAITGLSEPLANGVLKSLISLLGTDQAAEHALRGNKGSILLQSANAGEHAAERATFAAQVLLCFLEREDALGYSTKSGYFYRPRSWASAYSKRRALEPLDIFTILDSVHFMSDSRWIHTHGLEQFDLPDVEIRYKDRWKEEYYGDLIVNTAVYCIERGPVLKVGNTAEMMGDGVVFKVVRPRLEPGHHYGKFGVVGLAKV